jgi:hypothetical protein
MTHDSTPVKTYATLANMRAMQAKGARYDGPNRLVALNQATGEEFSAHPGDYFYMAPDECLKGKHGRKLVLAFVRPANHVLA